MSPKIRFTLIIFTYILWAFAYPPFPFGIASFFILIPAFYASKDISYKHAFWLHFTGGIFFNTIMYYWLYYVMAVGPALIILCGLILGIICLSFVNGYLGLWFKYFQTKKFGGLIFCLVWTGFEVARTKGQMSFPWSHMGYSLGNYLECIQIISIVGIFGLTFLIVGSNVLIYRFLQKDQKLPIVAVLLGIIALFVFGYFRINYQEIKKVEKVKIALVQPSIEQQKKWDRKYFDKVIKQTFDVMNESPLMGMDLIVLAETSIPSFLKYERAVAEEIQRKSYRYNSDILLGSLDMRPFDHPVRTHIFFNSAFLFSKDSSQNIQQYSKMHLVPFSERLPFDNIFPLINYVNLGEGDFASGDGIKVWGKKFRISPSICYEVVYPKYIRDIRNKGTDIMVNITNDGWFGKSAAPYQHANISKFRAVETGIPIARCANSGISVFYDVYGKELAKTKLFEKRVLVGEVPLQKKSTLYLKIGDFVEEMFFYLWLFLNLGIFGYYVFEKFPVRTASAKS